MVGTTVGFPVYNGADTIEASLRCILDGSFRDIKVVVSDNGSTDGTVDIVQSIAADDPRVGVVKQPENLGAVGNFRYLAESADTPLFMWRAHDDLSSPDYLEVLHQLLEKNENAVLAVSKIVTTKTNREKSRPFTVRSSRGHATDWKSLPHVQAAWVYGLFRTGFAQKCVAFTDERYGHLFGCDMIMLLHALLDGGVVGTNATMFNQRCLVLGRPGQHVDKATRRKLVRDFRSATEKLADIYGIEGAKRQLFRIYVWRYIFKRVVRWQKLI